MTELVGFKVLRARARAQTRQIYERDCQGRDERTFADDILLRAMLPEASTTKMTRAPAFLASRLLRMSDFSTYTLRSRSPSAACRVRLLFWYGAAVRNVASTANRFTLLPVPHTSMMA